MFKQLLMLLRFKKAGVDTTVEDTEPLPTYLPAAQVADLKNVTVSNPTANPETGLAKEAKQLPDNHQVTVSNFPAFTGLTDDELRDSPVPIEDLGERDEVIANMSVTASGDTTVMTPALGNRFRLKRIMALNKPTALTSPMITIKLGAQVVVANYAVAMRQRVLGPVNGPLVVNLSEAGEVAFTYILEEVAP